MYVTRMSWDQPVESGYFAITPIKSWLNWLNVWVWDIPYIEINKRGKDYKLRVYSWITRIQWDLAVTPFGLSSSKNTTEFYVNPNGISMFWSPYFFRGTGDNAVRWLSVNWPIFAWHSGNYIYMYANWSSATSDDRSYEILWENELAVGTRWWAFIYFTQRTGTFDNITGWEYPWVIHERNGIINTVWCNPSNPPANAPQWILWWNISPQTQCTIQNRTWHNFHGVLAWDLAVDKGDAYNSLMVWVNTDNPQATLDVNGSLRVWSNCVDINLTCNENNEWTMMYLVRKSTYKWSMVLCRADGVTIKNGIATIQYAWYDMVYDFTWSTLGDLWFTSDDWSCKLPKPNRSKYPSEPGFIEPADM